MPAIDALVQGERLNRQLVRGRPYFYFVQQSDGIRWLESMEGGLRRQIHLQVAERLAAGFDAEPEQVAKTLPRHRQTAESVPYVLAATERLQAALAYERAVHLLEHIHSVTEGALHVEVGEQLGELYSVTGKFEKAKDVFQSLCRLVPSRSANSMRGEHIS